MEDITKHWSSLSLSEIEGPGLCLRSDQATDEFGILARFLTKRPLNIEAIAKTFNPLWRSKTGFRVKNIGDHIVLFSFDNKSDVDRILSAEPWSFDKHIMVLSRYNRDISISELDLTKVPFWVHVHDIPLRFRNREIAEQICQPLGPIIHPNEEQVYDGGNFIRVRVLLDISQPLCRGRLLTMEDGKNIWVSLKYERLPNLCYWCGCLTHDDRDCDKWFESEGGLNSGDRQFGPWLRASPFSASRKNVVYVPGYYASKKASTSTSSVPAPHPTKPTTETSQPPAAVNSTSPRALNENPGNGDFEPVSASSPTQQNMVERSGEGSAPIFSKLEDFERTLQDLDTDIHGFDKGLVGIPGSKDHGPVQHLVHLSHADKGPDPSATAPLAQPDKTNSAHGSPTLEPDKNFSNPTAEGKWLRIQRPIHSSDITSSEAVLGKRSPLSHLKSPIPLKRRAVEGAVQDSNESFPPSAEAVAQPRRGR